MGLNISATRTRCGAMPLSDCNHFPLVPGTRGRETRHVGARMSKARDETLADRISDPYQYDGSGGAPAARQPPRANDLPGRPPLVNQLSFSGMGLHFGGIGTRVAIFDQDVVDRRPSELPEPLPEILKITLRVQVVRGNPVPRSCRTRSGCCARAASGHVAAPPTRVMNSRRFS